MVFLFTGLVLPAFAAGNTVPASFYFQQLDNRNGLSNSAVNIVFQDDDELVWVGTWDGLNMYDGTDFSVFNYNNETRLGTIGNNVIQDIKADKKGNIWMSTIGGITRLEKPTGKFYNYFYNLNTKSSIAEKEYELRVDASGRIFCYSRTNGLSRFDPEKNVFIQIRFPGNGKKIVKMECAANGMIWILEDDGYLYACRYGLKGLELVSTIHPESKINNFFIANHQVIVTSDNRNIAIAGLNGYLVPVKGRFDGVIKTISYYMSHYIIAWESQGISVYNNDFTPAPFMQEEVKRLAATRVTAITPARDKVLWMGTDGNGLIKIYPKINPFTLVNEIGGYKINKPVRAFCGAGNNLWIATKGQGVVVLADALPPGSAIKVSQVLNTANGLADNSVYALKKGVGPYVYIGTDGKGLDIYDLQAKRILKWQDIKGSSGLPVFGSVYAILQDRDSTLWLGTSGSGLIHLRLRQERSGQLAVTYFKQYLSAARSGPANDIIYAIADGQDGRLWIACRYGGLSVLNKKTGTFKTFRAFAYPNSLSNNDVLSLYLDKKKKLWIGTSYGLNALDYQESFKEKPVFKKYTMEDGLPNNTIHALEEASPGGIWVSTNKGLARLNTTTQAMASFRESDGLQSNEFSDGAAWKSPAGYIYFGGIYGFNSFLPEQITESRIQPNLLVTRLQLGGKTVGENKIRVLKNKQGNIPGYTLERKSNFFQISLKSMSFLNPSKNEFAYRLDGLDKEWNYSGATGNISYNNISPGDYTLVIKWSNGEGVWTKGVSVMKIHVEQYFWITYPALLLYLTVILVSGYAFHIYRKNKLEMKYKLEMESLLRKKDEDEHQQRLNFFTNIAHEIQTPLTLIMGSVEHFLYTKKTELFKNKENNYFLSIVHQHTARLTYLVQQLLEFRKAEAGYLKRTDDYVDVSKMMDSLSALFNAESEKKSRSYIRQIQEGVAGFIDKDKLEKILFNLLSNAFKHSKKEDMVRFIVNYDEGTHLLEVTVSNSGCRLAPEDLEHIFTKFYTLNEQSGEKFSTGIGLAFTKELVSLMGAEISVDIKEGWIHFVVRLQLESKPEHGKEEEVITSAPSYLYESLVKHHEQPEKIAASEENKNSLIDELQQRAAYSILLVEDEPELRFMIGNILKDQYIVYEAGSGTEALALLKKTTPSLIISDVMMPDMDGLALCRIVKQTPSTSQIPFIILSARGTEEQKAEGYEVGADAYIPKPFHINYLHVRIRKLLDYQERMQNLIKDQHITNQFMDTDIPDMDKQFLDALLKAIEKNLTEPELNAAMLEEALSISKMQLYRKLKSLTGMTPAEFIKRIRLKHAADMLLASQYNVSEIFYRTGFNNKSYFFREFKKIYQCAPNDYRQRQHGINQ